MHLSTEDNSILTTSANFLSRREKPTPREVLSTKNYDASSMISNNRETLISYPSNKQNFIRNESRILNAKKMHFGMSNENSLLPSIVQSAALDSKTDRSIINIEVGMQS